MAFICQNCGKEFARNFTLKRHIKNKVCLIVAAKTKLCTYCQAEIHEDYYDSHIMSHKRKYNCRQCQEVCVTRAALCAHQKQEHKGGSTAVKCRECDISFPNRKEFYKHHAVKHLLGGKAATLLQPSPYTLDNAPWAVKKKNTATSTLSSPLNVLREAKERIVSNSPISEDMLSQDDISDDIVQKPFADDEQSVFTDVDKGEQVKVSDNEQVSEVADDEGDKQVTEVADDEGGEQVTEVADGEGVEQFAEVADGEGGEKVTEVADGDGGEQLAEVLDGEGDEQVGEVPDGEGGEVLADDDEVPVADVHDFPDDVDNLLKETWEINRAHILKPHKIGN